MRHRLTIGARISISFALTLAAVAALSGVAISGLRSGQHAIQRLVDSSARKLSLAGEVRSLAAMMLANSRGMILYAQSNNLQRRDAQKQSFFAGNASLHDVLERLRPLLTTPESRQIMADAEEQRIAWANQFQVVARLTEAGKVGEAWDYAVANTWAPLTNLQQDVSRLSALEEKQMAQDKSQAEETTSRDLWLCFASIAVCLAASVGGLVVIRQVNRRLRRITSNVGEVANQVASAAGQVSASGMKLSQGASEQAASIEETSASTTEISSITRKNAENALHASELMRQEVSIVGTLNKALSELDRSIAGASESSDEVSKIIRIIDAIAFQTNILALNAAVEAARAGEAGLGFAVVADEVRNLAHRSAQAARETAGLIEEAVRSSQDGRAKLQQVLKAMEENSRIAGDVRVTVDEVSVSSQEQARGLEQISKAISQMEQVTQENAASAEQNAAAGEELTAQAEGLREIAVGLMMMVDGVATSGREKSQ